jgi:hypothetical protein
VFRETEPQWTCQQSVDVSVPPTSAWQFMTDVRNWSDPPAEFTLDGPFAPGTRGTTRMPGQPANSWMIRDVDPGVGYTIVGALHENVTLFVYWRFDPLPDGRTRLTQRLELRGENAPGCVDNMRAAFEPNLGPGMQRIARMMIERAGRDR